MIIKFSSSSFFSSSADGVKRVTIVILYLHEGVIQALQSLALRQACIFL